VTSPSASRLKFNRSSRLSVIACWKRALRQSLNLAEILNTTVEEVRQFLQADRVMIYRFDANQDGVLVAESVTFNRTLDSANIHRIFAADLKQNPENKSRQLMILIRRSHTKFC